VAAAILVAAFAYAVLMPTKWDASQSIVVRDNAPRLFGAGLGSRSAENAKNTQQTLQEIVHSRSLLRNVLEQVGPPEAASPVDAWPDDQAVAALREEVSLTPPKGIEVGASDVFYLRVRDPDRNRSLQLTNAVYAELAKAYGELRATVAQSEIAELKESVTLAEDNLARATRRVAEIEKEVGVDLVALRMLHQSPTGDTYVFRALTGAVDELRQAKAKQSEYAAMQKMLSQAEENPLVLAAAPPELLQCHPGLSRLIQGLADSRLRCIADASRLTEEHCDMRTLRREEAGIRDGIRQELASAIQGVSAAQELTAVRHATLETLVGGLESRLAKLTDVRAEYSNLVTQVDTRRNLVEDAHRNLAQASAAFTAATASSILSRMDLAEGALRPAGPSRAMVGIGGLLLSVLGGVGIVLLTAPIERRESPIRVEQSSAEAPRRARSNGRGKVKRHLREALVACEDPR
jgi:uncharacterized protein involved in exopolysaccharide biosynthesis